MDAVRPINNRRMTGSKSTIIPRPKRLSKAGEFMRQHPGGIVTIIDYKAVCK